MTRRSQTAATAAITIRDAIEADLPTIVEIYNSAIASRVSTAQLLYVSEEFRRRGVARQMLQEAIARAPQLKVHSLVGLIFGDNEPSIALFRTAGFERWGFLPAVARVDEIPRDLTIFGRHV